MNIIFYSHSQICHIYVKGNGVFWHILCLKLAFKNIFTLVYIGPHKTWQMMKTYKAGVWIYKHISKIKQKETAEGKKKTSPIHLHVC